VALWQRVLGLHDRRGLLHLSAFSVEPLFLTKTKTLSFAAISRDLSSFSSFPAESSKSSPITLIG
jgi:hypothetical protein